MALPTGLRFEKFVASIYSSRYRSVNHDVILKKKNYLAQFDIVYGSFSKHYIECKYKSINNVSLSSIATFYAKLELFNISPRKGIVITNADFTPRAQVYAKKKHLTLINGDQLEKLYVQSLSYLAKRRYKKNNLSLDSMILSYRT